MLNTDGLFILLLTALAAITWWHHTRAREVARQLAKRACRESGLQLLDDSVGLRRVRPRRRPGGWELERTFAFDFSRNGADRWTGQIVLRGHRLVEVLFDLHNPGQEG